MQFGKLPLNGKQAKTFGILKNSHNLKYQSQKLLLQKCWQALGRLRKV
jgi:hypothetical protein